MDKAYLKQEFDNLADELNDEEIEKLLEFAENNNITVQEAIGEILSLGENAYYNVEK